MTKTKLVAAMAPQEVVQAMRDWIAKSPYRNMAVFLRNAVREKLKRDGYTVDEPLEPEGQPQTATPVPTPIEPVKLDDMLTPDEAAKWMQMSQRDFKAKSRAGLIPCFRLGRKTHLYHPRTIIAKLAHDEGVPPEVLAASFGITLSAPPR